MTIRKNFFSVFLPYPSSSAAFPLRILCLLLLFITACSSQTPTATQSPNSTPGETDSKLTVYGGILEQFDEVGRPIWSVKAKQARYTEEKEIGQVDQPYGELYQDGKVVYQITAEKADIQQNGQQLFLKGRIFAKDPRNGIMLYGNELEWRPKEDLLIVRDRVNGQHKQLQAIAKEAKVKTREQRIDFFGGVLANSADPPLQIRTEQLIWQIKDQKLIGDRPVQIDHYKNKRVTDRGRGDSAEINLKTKIATINKNSQIELLDPPMQIASNAMTWNLNTETVKSNTPVRVFHKTENVTVTGNQGELKIPQKTVYLTGNVNGVGQKGQSIQSDNLTWYLDRKTVEAQGNVTYRQVNPPMTFNGDKAQGNIQTENIVVKAGNTGKRVITEIIPQENIP